MPHLLRIGNTRMSSLGSLKPNQRIWGSSEIGSAAVTHHPVWGVIEALRIPPEWSASPICANSRGPNAPCYRGHVESIRPISFPETRYMSEISTQWISKMGLLWFYTPYSKTWRCVGRPERRNASGSLKLGGSFNAAARGRGPRSTLSNYLFP